jgi:hypothetical protein
MSALLANSSPVIGSEPPLWQSHILGGSLLLIPKSGLTFSPHNIGNSHTCFIMNLAYSMCLYYTIHIIIQQGT